MLYIDDKFARMLSSRVKNFRNLKQYTYNFSCDVCGDMGKGRQRTRGYVYRAGNSDYLNYKCHHCAASMTVGSYLKKMHPDLYKEYSFERYTATNKKHVPHKKLQLDVVPAVFANTETLFDSHLEGLKNCANLSEDHPVAKYLRKRMIPKDKWDLLYFTRGFKKYTNSVIPNKFKDEEDDHPRLVIPYFNNHGKMFAFVGRAFGKEEPKYYTIKLTEEDRVFGLDRIDASKKIYATEGPIDSLFLPNAIAVSGSSFDNPTLQSLKSRLVIVHDNEPRSREITKIIKKNIQLGYSICLFPHSVKEKDINEMIQAGYTQEEIVDTIDENTYHGIEALMRFTHWSLV